MEKTEINEIAELVSEKTVKRTFELLGVDLSDQDSVNAFRRDLIFMREMRSAITGAKKKAGLVIIGMICTGVLITGWRGLPFHQ